MDQGRRRLLQAAGLAAFSGALPGTLQRALAIPAQTRHRDVRDIDHIVVFMQENRAFDHYFATLAGVRGHGDPRPLGLVEGCAVWRQAEPAHPDGYVLPFHADSRTSRALAVGGADQSHQDNLTIYNGGRCDRWGASRQLHRRMAYYTAADLPFYYALASAFTVCDAYHCSAMAPTYSNRLHLWTGCNGGGAVGAAPVMRNYGELETPCSDQDADLPLPKGPLGWTTYAERLEAAGVSWKVYQEYDNFQDNLLSLFAPFRPAPKDSALYRRGRAWVSEHETDPHRRRRSTGEQLVEAFRRDVAENRLPQVSWIVPAEELSEHPSSSPAKGEHLCAELVSALVDHPEVFARTVFLVVYDEAGGFFDHMPPPTPPVTAEEGASTVSTAGESRSYSRRARNPGPQPIGLGPRTPAIIVSPWSRGGYVCSQLFDHTSILQLMEACFGVAEPNISPWRRAVCGDLLSCFDFDAPNQDWSRLMLPSTEDHLARTWWSLGRRRLRIPEVQSASTQPAERRPSRPLPYRIEADGRWRDGGLRLEFVNRGGGAGAAFLVRAAGIERPWRYTVGAGDELVAAPWPAGACDVSVYGPDGFFRRFRGEGVAPLQASFRQAAGRAAVLDLESRSTRPLAVKLTAAPGYERVGGPRRLTLPRGETRRVALPLGATHGWYDLTLEIEGAPGWQWRFAGRCHDGRPGFTDPGIGEMRL